MGPTGAARAKCSDSQKPCLQRILAASAADGSVSSSKAPSLPLRVPFLTVA